LTLVKVILYPKSVFNYCKLWKVFRSNHEWMNEILLCVCVRWSHPVGQWLTQRWERRWRYPGAQLRQSLGEAPVQVAHTWSQGIQKPRSTPSASSWAL